MFCSALEAKRFLRDAGGKVIFCCDRAFEPVTTLQLFPVYKQERKDGQMNDNMPYLQTPPKTCSRIDL